MFEEKKKYNSSNFVVVKKVKIKNIKVMKRFSFLPLSTFNYIKKIMYEKLENYSLAYKFNTFGGEVYLDFSDGLIYRNIDASNVGDVVVIEEQELINFLKDKNCFKKKLSCFEVICLYNILFDEKIIGSIHFTPGRAYQDAFNGNISSIHWDMVLIERLEYGGGSLYFDDVLIRENGKFVIPELEPLNYNLK